MEQSIKKLTAYLNSARSVFHAVAGLAAQLEGEGYTLLSEGQPWQLEKGGKYYLTRGGSSLIAFRVPKGEALGFAMTASHSDRPTFKVKENGELVSAYTRLAVERYGGMLIAPWLDRPLSVAGRVVVKTPQGIQSRLVDMDQDLAMIPNVAIHMNRQANEGYKWNPATDVLPLLGTKQSAGKFFASLENQAGGQILGHDLTLYVRESARVWGMDSEFISAPALDDLQCAFGCAQGFLNAGESGNIPVLCVFDSEEVGSGSLQGAASDLLEATLSRVCEALRLDKRIMLSHSFLISADNAHALHPNHPELADSANAPVLGGGIAIKFNANQKYTSSGMSAAVMRAVCQKAGVSAQTYCNRADIPGGSTLGNISLSQVSVLSVDIGLPQLAMHSCYETAAVADYLALEKAIACFYSTTLRQTADGAITID
ncbi:MAG: M18 family aminopeptidase [Oscillospiraceae bacterium]|nr:M18 family aminopeptidase [Oscillospiraceae bacterium]